jgi:deoxyribonuclease-4
MGNALHYTQIKKSDLKFEPLAEFLAEEGDWLDVTIISDSPLLEHDAMFMLQQYDRAKHRLLEKKARDERNIDLALKAGLDPAELAARTKAEKEKRIASEQEAKKSAAEAAEKKSKKAAEPKKKAKPKKSAAKAADDDDIF